MMKQQLCSVNLPSRRLMWLLLASTALFGCFRSCFAADDEWKWGYEEDNGPSHWATKYPYCNGSGQSPINIETDKVTHKDVGNLVFTGYDTAYDFTIDNSGYTIQVLNHRERDITVSGGHLSGTYMLYGFHFHWGESDSVGSEHTIDSKSYPVEMHAVHFKKAYGAGSINYTDGFVAIGVFLQIGDKHNSEMEKVLAKFANVAHKGQNDSVDSLKMRNLLPSNVKDFFHYEGSYTTPNCKESVIWTVFKEPITITSQQLEKFRTLKSSEYNETTVMLSKNYRPVQPVNDRTVYFNSAPSQIIHNSHLITIAVAALVWALTARY